MDVAEIIDKKITQFMQIIPGWMLIFVQTSTHLDAQKWHFLKKILQILFEEKLRSHYSQAGIFKFIYLQAFSNTLR